MQRSRVQRIGASAGIAVLLILGACSNAEPAESESASAAPTVQSESVESVESAESVAALVPQYDAYRLSYSSTCGDGPYFSGGTDIEVQGREVIVTGGEEPFMVGSLVAWNDIAAAAAADGRTPRIEIASDGSLTSLDIDGRGIDDEFCVNVTAFEDLSP